MLVAGTTRLDFDANTTRYDDGASAVGDLAFHDATGPVFSISSGVNVVRFANVAGDGDDIQLHVATIQICSVP